jgi:hypothetical protein
MALETVDIHSRVKMTATTKMICRIRCWITAICVGCHVTVNTLFEAVLPGTDTFMYRQVTLMQNVIHVITPHIRYWLDTGLCLTELRNRFRTLRRLAATGSQQACQEQQNQSC